MESIIHPLYHNKESIKQLQNVWRTKETFRHLLLTKFLTKEAYKKIKKALNQLSYKRETRPNQYSFAKAKATTLHILDNKELRNFLSAILEKKVKNIRGEAYSFSWKDYTLLRKKQEKTSIDIIFDCTENWREEWGGACIYRDEKGHYLKLLPTPNTLIIIERKNIQRYIQYSNNLSRGKKHIFLLGTLI